MLPYGNCTKYTYKLSTPKSDVSHFDQFDKLRIGQTSFESDFGTYSRGGTVLLLITSVLNAAGWLSGFLDRARYHHSWLVRREFSIGRQKLVRRVIGLQEIFSLLEMFSYKILGVQIKSLISWMFCVPSIFMVCITKPSLRLSYKNVLFVLKQTITSANKTSFVLSKF